MKIHEKIDLSKDEFEHYKNYGMEYFDYKLFDSKEELEKLVKILNNRNEDEVSAMALAYWLALSVERPLEKAFCGLRFGLGCESPIEMLYYYCFCYICREIKANLYLMPQVGVRTEQKEYRVDFQINGEALKGKKYIVECDGYEYHSSSKQQAKDNQRQRDLENAGYVVIRLSGSEIFNDPIMCVYETLKRLNVSERACKK